MLLLGLTVTDGGMALITTLSVVCGVEFTAMGDDCSLILSNGKSDTVTLSVSHFSPIYPSAQTQY